MRRRLIHASLIHAGLIAASLLPSAASAQAPERVYDFLRISDMEELGQVLQGHVAHVLVKIRVPEGQLAMDTERDGFGVVIEPNLVATLCFNVQDARSVKVAGPKGQIDAKVVLYDVERRVALLRTTRPVQAAGLTPVRSADPGQRARDLAIFALTSTHENPTVLSGWVTHDGKTPELEGHPRVSLALSHGMPVFDARAHFVGYARAVAWDGDKQLLVVPEMIAAARTATAAAASEPPPEEAPRSRLRRRRRGRR